ncbi:GNAT family N-acetyltransferase [Modestobacter sp. NPDC049651]|uniref:GNAT family N-acetyltransferase n=1 Tax=unclassified Modestobacter TaxID=2643866 RepID=UPI0033DFD92A
MPDWALAGPEAAPAVARLWARATARRDGRPLPAGPGPDLLDAVRRRLGRPGAVVLLGWSGGELVACGVGTRRGPADDAELSLVAVAPERWGAGLGGRVLRRLEEELARAGYRRGALQVLAANRAAVRLYEAAGWRRLPGELPPHRDGPQLAYAKDPLTGAAQPAAPVTAR